MADPLKRALEQARFERAMEVAASIGEHRALLTTAELARLNRILTGAKDDVDPWRREPATLTLIGGKSLNLDLIADPVMNCRDKLHRCTEIAERRSPMDATIAIYTDLVLSHFFNDANRRTAALAAHYFFSRYDIPLSGLILHELGLGDLREPGQIESLKETLEQVAKFGQKRKS